MTDVNGYNEWHNRVPKHPDLPEGSWVRLLPEELGGGVVKGKINWKTDHREYAVVIPFGGNGALIYVHQADVEPCEEHEPESKFPIDTITRHLISTYDRETLDETVTRAQLDDMLRLTWPVYREIGYDGRRTVLTAVARRLGKDLASEASR